MRAAGKMAAELLDYIEPFVVPGVSTGELDRLCHDWQVERGATPAPLDYKGFPKSICTSINEVICHGIPGDRELLSGDIVNIDVTPILDGYHGDTSEMFFVGEVDEESRTLVEVTRRCLWLGIAEVGPGKRIGDIGAAIAAYARDEHGYGVVEAFCGHGIGRIFHTAPQVPHAAKRGTLMRMKPGMTFTIEPMINVGTKECDILEDGWTAVTRDGKRSAQAEHTILVTKDGHEVLTMRDSGWRPS